MATEPECSALNRRSPALSWAAQGMAMAPTFKRPVRTACHSGTLPRRTITLSPRPTPISRATLANLFERTENWAKSKRRSSPFVPSQTMAARSCAAHLSTTSRPKLNLFGVSQSKPA